MEEIRPGKFYGVGVGPGDPSLLTLRAMEVLRRCPVLAAPRTGRGGMVALEIVRPVLDLSAKTILPLEFSMSRDPAEREHGHSVMADAVLAHLAQGRDVAMVNLGDVSLYASAGYLQRPIRAAGFETELIPGVTSCSAAAAALGRILAEGDAPLHILPALGEDWREALDLPGTKVLMKPGKRLQAIYTYLKQTDRLACSALVLNCGMEGERLIDPFTQLPDEESYFTLVIVKEASPW